MIFKTDKNGITIDGKTIDEISDDFDKLSNYISNKTSKISSDLSSMQDKLSSKNIQSTWGYGELPDNNISKLTEDNFSMADKIREQKEYNELLENENSSVNAAIELSKRRTQNYDESLSKLIELNNEYKKQHQLESEDKYNSTIKERNNEYDKYLSNLNAEIEESKKAQDAIENISPDVLEDLGYKQKGYLKELREEQKQFSDALTRIDTSSIESLLPKKEEVKGYYDELLSEQKEFQNQLNAIETTPIDSLKRDQFSEVLSEQADGQMALNLSAMEYNDTLSAQNDLSNQRVLTLSEEENGQMALVMAENEAVSVKQKDIAETTSQIAAKEALIEASNKELLSNVNEKLAKAGVTNATDELTIAKLREVAASNEEGSALAKETLEMLGLGEASKATSIALKGLAMVGNMIAAWAIAEVLQLVVKGLDELANSVDNCKERVDNLMSSYKSALDTANSNASRVEELASDYEKLSKGVNNLGENVSLTSEEYEQYNSLVSEIADMFPTLIQGYNDQGTAILNLKGNVEGLRDAYKEAQTEAYNMLIASGEDNDGNDIIKQWEDIHDPGFFAGLFDLGAADVGGKISVSDALAQLKEIQNLTAEEYRNIENIAAAGSHKEIESLTDIQKEIGYGSYIGKALGIDGNVTDEEFEKAKKQAKVLVQTYNAEIESALSDVETLANAYLMTNDDYSKLTDNSKTAASLLVNNLTEDIANDFSSKEDVGAWVDSVVSKLQNNPKLSDAINGLFTTDLSSLSVDNAKDVVDQYINTIAEILHEDPVELKVRLGFDDYNDEDIAPLKTKVQGFLKDEFDDKVGELSLDDLQIASNLEIPEGTLLSWDELKQKIEETKNAASIETPISSFEEAWKKLKVSTETMTKSLSDDLLKLAQNGQLTTEAFENADSTGYFKKLGISADEAVKKINNLVDSSTQLSSLSGQISKMSDMLADKKNGTVASASDLAGFDVEVRGLDSWEQFEKVMGSTTSTMEECQAAADVLATEWINSGNYLENLTDDNKNYYITQLQSMGVKNAEEIVTDSLVQKTNDLALAEEYANAAKESNIDITRNLVDATGTEIQALLDEGKISVDTASKLAEFVTKKKLANGTKLSTAGDIKNLADLAGATTKLGKLLTEFARIKQLVSSGMMPGAVGDTYMTGLQEQIETLLNGGDNANIDVNINPLGSSSYKSFAKNKEKQTTEIIDFIEIAINRLQATFDKLKNKSEQTFRSMTSRINLYANAIEKSNEMLSLQQQALSAYTQRRNSVGLDEYWAKQVRDGSINIADITDDTLSTQIKSYQQWNDKIIECRTAISDIKDTQRELIQDSIELVITKYDNLISKIESANDHISKKIDIKEALGFSAKTSDYTAMNVNIQKQIGYNDKQIAKLKELQKTVSKASEAWYKYQERIDSTKASTQDLTLSIAENAKSAAELAKATADKKVDKYDSKDELYDAKIDNATSAKSKNSLINKKISNIINRQSSYNTAVSTDNKNISSAKKVISKFKSTKENKNILSSIKKLAKSGKRISQSLLDKALKLNDNGKLYQACVQYNAYLDARDADKAIADLYNETAKKDKATLAKEKFDNISKEYEYKLSGNEQKKTAINNQIALAEEQGRTVSTAYYDGLMSAEEGNKNKLIKEREDLQKSLNEAITSGSIKQGSEEWYDMLSAINDVTNAIDESTKSLVEYKNTQRQLKWDLFDDALETIKRTNSEADYYINIMSHKDLIDEDNGRFTEYATATLKLHNTNYESYLSQAQAYQNEYNDLIQKIAKGEESIADENVVQRLRTLQDAHRDARESAENELQSIQDLVKQGYEAQIDALNKLIDNYKKLRNSAKEAYEYQRNIEKQIQNISALQKQLSAFGGNDSEESRAKIQKLKVELQDATDELRDTEYEKYLSDTEDMLDDLMNDYQSFIDEKLSDTNGILTEIKHLLSNDSDIVTTLKNLDSSLTNELSNLITGNVSSDSYTSSTIQSKNNETGGNVSTSAYDAGKNVNEAVETQKKSEAEKAKNAEKDKINKIICSGKKRKKTLTKEEEKEHAELWKYIVKKYGVSPTWTMYRQLGDVFGIKTNEKATSAQKNAILKQMKLKGYATGSKYINEDGLAWTQEKGSELVYHAADGSVLTPLGRGDMVFTNEMSQRLWEMSQMNPAQLGVNTNVSKMPNLTKNINNTGNTTIEVGDIVMQGVNDIETFGKQLREEILRNGKTTQCITEAVSAKQLGKNGVGNARLYK